MTSIRDYDLNALPDLEPLPIGSLVVGTLNLLYEAADLPQPQQISVSDLQSVDLQFASEQTSLHALARWAMRFGGTVTSEPHEGRNGGLETWCRIRFDYYGVAVTAYAHVPVAEAAHNHSSYPHQPGRLHDCPACEARCHCTPGDAECVYDGQHNGLASS